MLRLWKLWFRLCASDLVSVIPVGVRNASIASELIGKVPGTLNHRTGRWVGTIGSLSDRHITEAEVEQAIKDGAAIGLLGRNFPGLDIDVEDETLAGRIQELAFEMLGPAPVRRREGSPRRLLMYWGPDIRKKRLVFHMARGPTPGTNVRKLHDSGDSANVKPNAVELLGRGQYYNVEGIHPSGQPYEWVGPHPTSLAVPYDFSAIDEAGVVTFYDALAALLTEVGWEVKRTGKSSAGGLSAVRTGLDDPSLHAPSPEAVLAVLAEYRPEALGHDDFVQHMVAIKAALGPTREQHYGAVLAWAPGIRSTEDDATRKVWDSIIDAAVGWSWLVDKTGTEIAAQGDFSVPVTPDMMPKGPDTITLEGLFERYVYWHEGERFVDLTTSRLLRHRGFCAVNRHIASFGKSGPKAADSIFIDHKRSRQVDTVTYRPGASQLLTEEIDGAMLSVANLYRPALLRLPEKTGEPTLWLDHLRILFPVEAAFWHFIHFNAFILQRPGEKIDHSLLLCAGQGIGKDTALYPLIKGVGEHNVSDIRPEDLMSPFNTYLRAQLIICSEMMNFEKQATYNTLKAIIANTRDWITINEKNVTPYKIPNVHNSIFLTNRMNAVSMEYDDRRMWVWLTLGEKQSKKYFDMLWGWLKDGGVTMAVEWMLRLDLSAFDPHEAPFSTPAKQAMMEATRAPPVQWLHEQFAEGGRFHGRMFITTGEIRDAAFADIEIGGIANHQIIAVLRDLKFVTTKTKHRIPDQGVAYIWTRDKHPEISLAGDLALARLAAERKKG